MIARTVDHHPAGSRADRVNKWIAGRVTNAVGTMWCAYVFGALALVSLPAALSQGTQAIVQWTAQTFLQLVLLSVILVGQNLAAAASDARAAKTFDDAERILEALDVRTDGGLRVVVDMLDRVGRDQGDSLARILDAVHTQPAASAAEPAVEPPPPVAGGMIR